MHSEPLSPTELRQAFCLLQKAGKGRIQTRELGELLRCLGWNPSEQDLEDARHELDITSGPSASGGFSDTLSTI